MAGFFPDAKEVGINDGGEEEILREDVPIALYATCDGWMIHEDMQMIEWLDKLDLDDEYRNKISDLLAKNEPGSFVRLPQAVLVVLANPND